MQIIQIRSTFSLGDGDPRGGHLPRQKAPSCSEASNQAAGRSGMHHVRLAIASI